VTFDVQLTGVELQDTRRNEPVTAGGLPLAGATITKN
jgi:hypothetical protein